MLSSQEAATALKEADITLRRSREAYSYSRAAPYLFIWGPVWVIGYGGEALARPHAGWIWTAADIAGVAASILVGRVCPSNVGNGWRFWALLGVIFCFSFALFRLLSPLNEMQVAAYWPLLFAAIYAAVGLWLGLRYVVLGVVLAAATLGAYFFLREYFMPWMALVGGGSLILTGFWMRQA